MIAVMATVMQRHGTISAIWPLARRDLSTNDRAMESHCRRRRRITPASSER